MRAVIQRVLKAEVEILGSSDFAGESASQKFPYLSGKIGKGLLVLLAVENGDTSEDAEWLASKILKLRVFEDSEGKMNLNLGDIGGEVLLVSQFTLYGNLKKGSRPSFNRSAPPEISIPKYEEFAEILERQSGRKVPRGVFGAMMNISLVNDGPVTIIIDSKSKDF